MDRLARSVLVAVIAVVMILGLSGGFVVHAAPTLKTDRVDYSPTQTVYINGTGWHAGATILVSVTRPGGSINTCSSPSSPGFSGSCTSANSSGFFAAPPYALDGILGNYTVTASDGFGDSATTWFLDSVVPVFAQCANGKSPSMALNCPAGWTNGDLNSNNSHYSEDQTVPQHAVIDFTGSAAGSHVITIEYQTLHGSIHAYDSLATWYRTQTALASTPCDGIGAAGNLVCPTPTSVPSSSMSGTELVTTGEGCGTGAFSGNDGAHSLPAVQRQMWAYGSSPVSITGVSVGCPHYITSGSSDEYADVNITVTISAPGQVLLLWAGHLACGTGCPFSLGWGSGLGSASISGAPFHMRITTVDGASVGSKDNQISPGFITPPPSKTDVCGAATTGKPVTCTATLTGGTPPYTVVWTAPGGTPSTATTTCATSGCTTTFTTTFPVKGTYKINDTVTDVNGAVGVPISNTIIVTPQPLVVSVNCGTGQTAGKPFSCAVSATGGTSPYSGTGTFTVTQPVKGTFTEKFNVTDANHVTVTGSTTVTVASQPLIVNVNCGTGQTAGKPFSCTVSATGGTAPYQGTGTFPVTQPVKGTFTEKFNVTDANHTTTTGSAMVTVVQQPFVVSVTCGPSTGSITAGKPFSCTVSATGGTAPYQGTGTFSVTQPVKGTFTESFNVKDANGKTAIASTQVTVVQQPFVVSVSCGSASTSITAGKPFTCTVSATGGTAPYQGTGTFQVTQPVKGTFTESFTVTDANGKSAVATTQVTVVQQPFVASVTCGSSSTGMTAGKPFSCTVSATGGTAPYQGTGTFQVTQPVKGTFTESFTVTDANGKSAFASTQVTIVQQPFVVSVSCGSTTAAITAGKPFSCTVSATGGTAPYQGVGTFQVTEPVKGTFTESFNVKDANGKTAVASTQVTVVQQPFVVGVTCGSSATAITAGKPFSCTVTATGGTAPYQGTGTFSITQPVKGTFTESFTVTDANGKSAIASTQVNVVQQPFVVSVTCGSSTAAITSGKPFSCTVSATGGTAPYQGTGTFQVTQPVKGTFTESFTVTDANGKSAVASTQVTVVQQPFVVSVSCGSASTSITAGKPFTCTVSATGGTAPYTGTGSFTVTQPVKGSFPESFTVTDANGKSAIASTTVTVVQQPFVVSVSCGSTSTSITAGKPFTCTVSATGGTAPYQGTGSFTVTQPVKGTFTESFTVTDANGKSAVASTQVTVVQQPFVVSVACGSSTAAITAGKPFSCIVSATGGTAPYQGVGTFQVTEPVKGTFTESFNVKDANGKTAVASTQVTVVQQPFVVSVSCGSSTAAITAGKPFSCTVSATGGTAPYRGTGTFQITQPVKGTFTESFTVTDANGKSTVASTQVTVVQQPFVVSVTCGSSTAPITAGKPFSCTVSATGGTAPYHGTGTFQVTQPVKGTFTESFTVTDANGKSAVASTQVTVVQQPFVVSVSCGSASSAITAGKPFTCTVSATGGTAPYTGTGSFTVTQPVKGTFTESFTVSDANGKSSVASTQVTVAQQPFVVSVTCGSATAAITAGKPFSCTVSATGGTAPYQGTGTFSITEPVKGTFTESFNVKDANGKTAVASTQVSVVQQPFVVSVSCGSSTAAITAGKPFTCTVSATGGTAPYQGTGTFQVTQPVKGTFTESFTVTDANGKSAVASTTVTIVQQPFVVSVTCGSSTAAITAGKPFSCTVSATGGTAPYTGTGTFTVTEPVKGTFTESFIVSDANGKSTVASTQVIVVQQPFVVSVSCGSASTPITAGKPFNCAVSASGGTAPYHGTGTFSLTQPVKGTFPESFTVTDANGKSAVASTTVTVVQQPFVVSVTCGSSTATITAGKPFTCTVSATGGTAPYQGAGSFTVTEPVKGTFTESFTVTDANGKSAIASTQVTVVQQPFVVSVTCGSAAATITAGKPFTCTVSATGGTAPYTGTGSFTVTQPVKGTFTESFTVSDANGKSAVATTTIAVVQQPFVVSVTCGSSTATITAGKPFSCTVSATGGTAPYHGIGTFTVTQPVKGTFTESFTVTDANGKSAIATTTVAVVQQPFVVSVTCGSSASTITAGKPFTCTVSATGGTAPYHGTGTFTVTQPVKGTFTEKFNVTDANSKSAVASTTVTVIQQPFVVSVTCGSSSAPVTAGKPFSCTVSATGGTAPYHGTGNFTVTQPVKGTFTESFTVTDANGKSAVASTTVTVVQQPFVVSVTCGSTGTPVTAGKPFNCVVSATGGTAPYQGTGTFSVTQPVKGTFTESFNVKDANGKTAVASTTVVVVAQPLVISVSCSSGATAGKPVSCTASATGGTSGYTFSWSGPGTPSTGSGASFVTTFAVKGTYTIVATVTDANGKTASINVQVIVAPQPLVASFSSLCVGSLGVRFTASVSGGTTPYSFSWNFGDSNTGTGNPVTHTYSSPGPFTVVLTVTDANGARATVSKTVTACGNVLTDTSFCPLPSNQFNVILVTDPANPGAFEIVSTNPGQFYDNVFDAGTTGTPVTLTINIPYPFVTQGAFPIQVSSSFNLVNGCFQPAFDQNGNFVVTTTGGNLSSSGHPIILLSNYGSSPTVGVTTTTVTVTGLIPASGLVYVTIHLAYGLKGQDFNKLAPGSSASCPASNTGPCAQLVSNPSIVIGSPQPYAFSFTDGTPSSTSPTSVNVFKKDPGFAGVVTNAVTGAPIAGATVKIYDGSGHLLGITTTDMNGVYLFAYKYTGSSTTFTVKAITPAGANQVTSVPVKSNKLYLVSFQF